MGTEIIASAILGIAFIAVSIIVGEQVPSASEETNEIVTFIIVALIVAVFYFAIVALPAYQASLNIQNP